MPEKVYCQPEKKIKKSGREISKMGEKTAKKAGKSGRESRFLPEKKVKISPKYCFSGTLPFLGQKKNTDRMYTVSLRHNVMPNGQMSKDIVASSSNHDIVQMF